MAHDQWISWRVGRNFNKWHAREGHQLTKCGTAIPPQASVCYAADEFVRYLVGREVCTSCRRLRLAERIP